MGLITNLIEKKIERAHEDEQNRQQALRQFYFGRINDQNTDPAVKEQLSKDYLKLLSPDAKKHAQQGIGMIAKLRQKFGGGPQQPQQAPQQQQQPAPAPQFAPGAADREQGVPKVGQPAPGGEAQPTNPKAQFNSGPGSVNPFQNYREAEDRRKRALAAYEQGLIQQREVAVARAREEGKPAPKPTATEARQQQLVGAYITLGHSEDEAKRMAAEQMVKEEDKKSATPAPKPGAAQLRHDLAVQEEIEANPGLTEEEAKKRVAQRDIRAADRKAAPPLTEEDKLARAYLDSGKATDEASARKQAANAMVNLQAAKAKAAQGGGGGTFTPQQLNALADWSIATGNTPSFGLGANNPNRTAYQKALANKLAGGEGIGDALSTRTNYKAAAGSLNDMTKLRARVGSFEQNAKMNLKNAVDLSKQVPRTSMALANSLILDNEAKLTDYPQLAQFVVAARTAANEYARVVNSASGNGVSTESARKEANDMISTAMAAGAFDAAAQQMETEMNNRMKGIDDTIGGLQQQISAPSTPVKPPGSATSGKPKIKILSVTPAQ